MKSVLSFLTLFLVHITLFGSESNKQLIKEFNETKEKIIHSDVEKRKILSKLYRIKRKNKELDSKIVKLESEYETLSRKISNQNKILKRIGKNIKIQEKQLKKKIQAFHKFGEIGFLRLAFSSSDPASLDRNLYFLGRILELQSKFVKNFQTNRQAYKDTINKLKVDFDKLSKMKAHYKTSKKRLANSIKKRKHLLNILDAEKELNQTRLQILRAKTNVVSKENSVKKLSLIENILKPQIFELKGRLNPPLAGTVNSSPKSIFGLNNNYIRSKGVFFSSQDKDEFVFPVHEGQVAYAGPMNGYGNLIIIDHGDHYYSLYGFLNKIIIKVGNQVNPSKKIGKVGENSFNQNHGVYFEFRHFSEPQNPHHWLKL